MKWNENMQNREFPPKNREYRDFPPKSHEMEKLPSHAKNRQYQFREPTKLRLGAIFGDISWDLELCLYAMRVRENEMKIVI